jgi:L-histidine Nalpha-methyltransferase
MDFEEGMEGMLEEVAAGLARPQKELSPKFFYDQRGSELFEAITRLPEYYPTRTERNLLREFVPGWFRRVAPASVIELGAGAGEKTRVLLDAMGPVSVSPMYVPIDISGEFLEAMAARLSQEYPQLQVRPVTADLSEGIPHTPGLPRPAVFAFLGGTIGNFRRDRAVRLLGRISAAMEPKDRLLLGVDLVKDVEVLERAYNDAAGVTAEFNLNVLHVLNRELNADFDPAAFRHQAFFATEESRIEMHLVANRAMTVRLPGAGEFRLAEGETIRTEISCKYDRPGVEAMMTESGLCLEEWVVADPGFALAVGRRGEPGTNAGPDS